MHAKFMTQVIVDRSRRTKRMQSSATPMRNVANAASQAPRRLRNQVFLGGCCIATTYLASSMDSRRLSRRVLPPLPLVTRRFRNRIAIPNSPALSAGKFPSQGFQGTPRSVLSKCAGALEAMTRGRPGLVRYSFSVEPLTLTSCYASNALIRFFHVIFARSCVCPAALTSLV